MIFPGIYTVKKNIKNLPVLSLACLSHLEHLGSQQSWVGAVLDWPKTNT